VGRRRPHAGVDLDPVDAQAAAAGGIGEVAPPRRQMAELRPVVFRLVPMGNQIPNLLTAVLRSTLRTASNDKEGGSVSLLWIILIVILVLALMGFFTRGRW
jgi:hypothetical protein